MLLRFLVVDDSAVIAHHVAALLSKSYPTAEVETASTNSEAYKTLRQFSPDLIVTDWNRPGGTGREFIAALRQDPHTASTPIIVATGNIMDPGEVYGVGANALLLKPFAPRDLLEHTNRLLRLPRNPDVILIHLGYETRELDYKEDLDLGSKYGRASLAKDVIAMANWGGGNIVVGVAEPSPGEFDAVGISNEHLAQYEVTRLNRAIIDYLDPPVPVVVRRISSEGKVFAVLQIPPAHGTLILAARKDERAGLFLGRIYTRTTAAESAEVRHSSELRELLNRVLRSFGTRPA
jgi:CheY-like chemotaxis protein